MEPIASFQVIKTNKTVVKDGTVVIHTNVGYQYKPIAHASTYWPGKKNLKDLGENSNEGRNGSKGSGEEDISKGMFIKML